MLWSSIHIPPLDHLHAPASVRSGLKRTVEAWLERSATCPLSVSLFDFTNRVALNANLEEHPFALQLMAVSRRLRCLALAADAELIRPLLQLDPGNFPLLKSIRMKTLPSQTPATNTLEIPSLEDVALCLTVANDPLSLPLPWSQLKRLRLECYCRWTEHGQEGGVDCDRALDILRKCPNLEQCDIQVTRPSSLTCNPSSVVLPKLHTLVLRGWEFQVHKWIDLVAPNLRSLQIGEVTMTNIVPRSNHACLSVIIDFTRFTTTSLHELLQSLPMISHLQLMPGLYHPDSMFVDDEFMALFSPPHNLCPRLTDIGIFAAPPAGLSDAAALAFIKTRMTILTPLRRFQAYFNRPMQLDLMAELQCFISDGLQVELEYPAALWGFRAQEGLDGPGAFY
ncbi:F-box domain-containing protein [Mycena sanguinolenta]|uniref:F-box domain-containing protein n=1 Tax=Mycena sanguinolenta TaxID=230812 RepID=A0A8H6X783_9AGAR|nr:F-box domain-containing protein [Mycena sanguinolenta]